MDTQEKKGIGKVIRIIVDVLVWILLIIAALLTIIVFTSTSNNGIPNLFGKMPISVQSGSMEKEFYKGDLIVSSKIENASELKTDDIISFWTTINEQKIINTHRIVEVKDNNGVYSFITKGDNNPINDKDMVMSSDLIGKYNDFKIPKLGSALDFLRTSNGFLFCILLPLLLFFLYEIYRFVLAIIAMKKPKLSKEDEDEIKRKAIEEYISENESKK